MIVIVLRCMFSVTEDVCMYVCASVWLLEATLPASVLYVVSDNYCGTEQSGISRDNIMAN